MAVVSTTVTVPAGVTSSGEIVITGGLLEVANGGQIVGTIVTETGVTFVEAGGIASGTTVQGNSLNPGDSTGLGGQAVEGVAISSLIASGGEEIAFGGGVTSGALVLKGGVEFLGGGGSGTAVGMTVNGGTAFVNSGGTASGTTVTNGGVMTVTSGGVDKHDSVGSGGTLNVSVGGVVSALTINDPNDPNVTAVVNVLSGGTVDGTTKIDGGQLILDAGAVFQPHAALNITNTGELVLEQNSFKGTINDFGGQDFMDLSKIKFIGQGSAETTATFTQTSAAGGQLQVEQGSHVVDLHLTGTYTTANFALQSDGAHGTTLTFVP